MKRALGWFSPATLAGRTALTLLVGLLVFHLGSVWLLEREARDALEDAREDHIADHAAMAARVLGAVPAEVRKTAADALSTPAFRAVWQPSASQEPMNEPSLAPLRERLERRAPELVDLRLRLGLEPPEGGEPARLKGVMSLADGSWVSFAAPEPDVAPVPIHATLASLSAMALGIVLASVLVVHWITHPLRRLAEAAETFGKGGAPVPMPENGPREVRDAARTFNAMQARIHSLVADRTQALAAVSHDLRTPIQRLRLRAGFIEDAEAQRATDADLDEMESMVEATLAHMRGDTEGEERRATNLAATLRTLCDDAADRGHAVTYSGPDHVRLSLRPVAIKRAFANLIENAVKHGGGTVRVTLQDLSGEVTVWVEDKGPGIPEEALERVFEPFRRLDESRNRSTGGTGLGLTIARRAVEGHGGTLTLTNRPKRGLAARVRFPRLPESKGNGGEA